MNLERISDALQTYTGREESMHEVVSILQEELGEDWTQTVFQDLQSLPPALKKNLTNVFNYYAATMAWNETQTYLTDPDLQFSPELMDRLPVLKHWLDFFKAPGQEAYNQLESRLTQLAEKTTQTEKISEGSAPAEDISDVEEEETVPTSEEQEAGEDVENLQERTEVAQESDEQDLVEEIAEDKTDEVLPPDEPEKNTAVDKTEQDGYEDEAEDEEIENDKNDDSVEEDEEDEHTSRDELMAEFADNPAYFEIQKLSNQVLLLEKNQAWLAARCIQLKNIEVYAYPFYGYIVDLMRQILKNMDDILANEEAANLIDIAFEGGREVFDHRKEAIEHDIDLAEQNCESATTALISDDMDMDEVKRTLGSIDETDTVEYVGPAPDGFELLDDETPLDEAAIKQQYEKLENMDALTGQKQDAQPEKTVEGKENTSQNEQKGVQRKLSFSLKKKKPTEGAS